MKRIFSTLCIVAMVALVATSCKKKTDEASSFNFTLEQAKGLELDDDAKAYIDIYDNCLMKWNEGDRIMVYNIDYDNYAESVAEEWEAYAGAQGQTTTGFHGVAVGAMKDMYFFFYHANKASGNLQAGNRETFTVNQVQTYNDQLDANGHPYIFDPTSLVMACPVTNGIYNQSYTFQHIFGFLNLKLKGNTAGKYVKEIELTDASWNLWGTMSLKICPEIDPVQFTNLMNELVASNAEGTAYDTYVENLRTYLQSIGYNANGQGKTIKLDCSKAYNGQGVPASSKYFFFSLRPGALYNGFSIKVTFMDGNSQEMSVGKDMNKLIKPGTFTNVSFNLI